MSGDIAALVERIWVYTKPGHLPRVHTQSQMEEATANGWVETVFIPATALTDLQASLEAERAQNAKLRSEHQLLNTVFLRCCDLLAWREGDDGSLNEIFPNAEAEYEASLYAAVNDARRYGLGHEDDTARATLGGEHG